MGVIQPEGTIDFEVYEDKVNYVGIAQVQLPDIAFLTLDLTGAGISGTIEAVLIGMVDKMTMTMNFRSHTGAAVSLMKPVKHNIDLRIAEQHWDTVKTERVVSADKYIMVAIPKKLTPGTVAPAAAVDANGEYSVYYYSAFKDGKVLWEVDPFNYICVVDGKDYMAEVRAALGK